jgi:hypothetical protein
MNIQKKVIPAALAAEVAERIASFELTDTQRTALHNMAASWALDHTLKGKWVHPNYDNLVKYVCSMVK